MMQKVIKILLVIIGSIIVIIALITATLVLTGNVEIGFDSNGNFQVEIKNNNDNLDSYDQIIQSTLLPIQLTFLFTERTANSERM